MGSIKYAAKKLIGKEVQITVRKNKTEFLPIEFPSYTFDGILDKVNDFGIVIKNQTGMSRIFPFEDEFFKIENIK